MRTIEKGEGEEEKEMRKITLRTVGCVPSSACLGCNVITWCIYQSNKVTYQEPGVFNTVINLPTRTLVYLSK